MKILITKTFNYYLDKFRIDKEVITKEYIKFKNSGACIKIGTYFIKVRNDLENGNVIEVIEI